MKFRLLQYGNTDNIGDVIQTLAVAQHVKTHSGYLERDQLNHYDGEPCAVVLNGWFSHEPQNWPPSPAITPIFFGFHMTSKAAAAYEMHKAYFKRHEPIGCRDLGTAKIMQGWGIDAYVSGCATMTFPRRPREPLQPKTFVVDVSRHFFNRRERADFVYLSQIMPAFWYFLSQETKIAAATALLALYREEAACVITSRIHCAMPCFAMGIPTIYCGPREYRTTTISDIGVPIYSFSKYRREKTGTLPFTTPDYDAKKIKIAEDLRSKLAKIGAELNGWTP